MRKNLPVTNKNNDYDSNLRIVSTTDTKGRVTYANDTFISISGFSRDELIGKNHNLVRHPDMPPAAFDDLWQNLKKGKSWMGIVKNRCKNGDHYWVDAFITPIFEKEEVVGYQSVRIKPSQKDIDSAEHLYAKLWDNKKSIIDKFKIKTGLMGKITLSGFISILAGAGIFYLLPYKTNFVFPLACVTILGVNILLAKLIAKPWQLAAKEAKSIFSNAVAQQVYTGRDDELGQLQLAIRMQKSKLETVIWRINDASSQLKDSVDASMATISETERNMTDQNREIEQVATAMNEMTATVNEIAQNTSNTASATQNADEQVVNGKEVVESTIAHISNLASEVENAMEKINTLAQDSKHIESIVNVITEIAEQTNLLALNAAIEAARAGEQGRGFAVVADEVRTLANRTQSSTHEIQEMISKLQFSAEKVVDVMKLGQKAAFQGVEKAELAGESLNAITSAMNTITQMTTQIATAAEEQSAVSEEINQNMIRICEFSEQTLAGTQMISSSSNCIDDEVTRLNHLVKQFGSNI